MANNSVETISPADNTGTASSLSKNGSVEESRDLQVSVDSEKGLQTSGESNEDVDQNIVWWNGDDDPSKPLNWSARLKWTHVGLVSAITLVSPLASSMFAPAVPELEKEFHTTNTLIGEFVVSIYVLGFALGPLVIAPLSEIYGRLPIYHTNNVLFVVWTIACAFSTDMNMLIGFRFLAGCAGSAALTVGGGTIADLFVQEERGVAMAVFSMGVVMGPTIGPVIGGFLSESLGWRWVFRLLAIVSGLITIMAFLVMRETYATAIIKKKTRLLRRSTGNMDLVSKYDRGFSTSRILNDIVRPAKILFLSPIVMALSVFMAVVYGLLYLLLTTFTTVFEGQYGFNSGTSGLVYLGLGFGSLCGMVVFGYVSDRIMKLKSATGEMKPEYRLPPLIWGAPFVPIGLFWYGWAAEAKVQWIVPIMGTFFIGVGTTATFMPILAYLIDAFTIYAASALAANTVLRSIFGSILPLAGDAMYAKLGLGWGNSVLGFIALAMCPIPLLFYRYGERIRLRFKLELH